MTEYNETEISELAITRIFDAPHELVYQAWTEPRHLKHWWGPKGFTMNVLKFDLCPGGVFHYSQKSPTGQLMWGKFVYKEFIAPEKLVFISSFSDEIGNTIRAPFSPTFPAEILNILSLFMYEGKTKLTLRGAPINVTKEEYDSFVAIIEGMKQGFTGTFAQLDNYLERLNIDGVENL
ncbi:SRPBCC domain-containing protein [Heliobacillus mobilis]|uniref:SRPBCC domain-containing protein n=1 Tax=Heliobacterium mobile TaxID=28064 RepID=A0A6I3SQ93_HELMO|nr:SRPBCC domain-containing protein [Heliobacterium mobile]MTV50896.1 SRPBCC domain-containing protein [Heliobacterium mobile]